MKESFPIEFPDLLPFPSPELISLIILTEPDHLETKVLLNSHQSQKVLWQLDITQAVWDM